MRIRGRGARRPCHWLLAIGLSLLSGGAMALGLGQIRVLSAPGQPLLAEIPIISNEPGELENARARLASPETFARVGLQPPSGLVSDLQFEITSDAQGRAVVRVTSSAPVDVPAVGFLVEVDWGQGRLVREHRAPLESPAGDRGGVLGPEIALLASELAGGEALLRGAAIELLVALLDEAIELGGERLARGAGEVCGDPGLQLGPALVTRNAGSH